MKLHRFIGDFDLSQKEVEITNPENIKQIKDVLRLRKDEKIILSDGKGMNAEVILNLVSKNKITGVVDKVDKSVDVESYGRKRKVNLYLAILKKENFEFAVQKSVEAGVHRIIPIITERTIKTGLNFPRLEKIMIEASEQSGRSIISVLSPIMNFKDALADGINNEEKVIFHLKNKLYEPNKNAESIGIFVGPEGGFTEKEISLAKEAGYIPMSLGSLTLRAETAAIIATYRTAKGI
ncbi:MAG: RsmE family RNA methyltransferase [Candidatus Paceibacterota bacterium]|jgi:16S rRNA (uracil1498-N3)-methyltransferase